MARLRLCSIVTAGERLSRNGGVYLFSYSFYVKFSFVFVFQFKDIIEMPQVLIY